MSLSNKYQLQYIQKFGEVGRLEPRFKNGEEEKRKRYYYHSRLKGWNVFIDSRARSIDVPEGRIPNFIQNYIDKLINNHGYTVQRIIV